MKQSYLRHESTTHTAGEEKHSRYIVSEKSREGEGLESFEETRTPDESGGGESGPHQDNPRKGPVSSRGNAEG